MLKGRASFDGYNFFHFAFSLAKAMHYIASILLLSSTPVHMFIQSCNLDWEAESNLTEVDFQPWLSSNRCIICSSCSRHHKSSMMIDQRKPAALACLLSACSNVLVHDILKHVTTKCERPVFTTVFPRYCDCVTRVTMVKVLFSNYKEMQHSTMTSTTKIAAMITTITAHGTPSRFLG
jgi:hypothetical protein